MPKLIAAASLAVLTTGVTACASAPGQPEPHSSVAGDYLAGRFAAGARDLPRAAAAYQAAAGRTDDAGLTARAFEYALAAGDVAGAARYAERVVASDEEAVTGRRGARLAAFQADDLPRLTLAVMAIEDRDWDLAIERLDGDYGSSLGQSLAFMLEGWALYGQGGVDAGTAHLSEPPQGVFAGFVPLHAALMYDLAGRDQEAQGTYAAALRTQVSEEAAVAFALLQEREGRDADAIDLYRRMTEQRGLARRVGRMGLARLGEPLAGESEAFIRLAKKADRRVVASAREGAALVLSGFARAAFDQASQEQRAAARAGFGEIDLYLNAPLGFARLATFLDPGNDAARYLAGAITATYDQPALAEAAYARVPPASAFYGYAAVDRAYALLTLERPDEAAALLEGYLAQDPLSPDVGLTLASIYGDDERWDEAMDAGTRAIEAATALTGGEEDALWRYYFARGVTGIEADRWTRGEADMRRALELSPEEPYVLNYLGYSYVERGERLDEAFGMIEQALRLDPNSGAITDSLGWAHYQRGEYETAVRYLEDAVRLEPGDDTITDHLGDAYWQAGRRTEARYEWRRVLETPELSEEMRQSVEAKLAGQAPAPGALAEA